MFRAFHYYKMKRLAAEIYSSDIKNRLGNESKTHAEKRYMSCVSKIRYEVKPRQSKMRCYKCDFCDGYHKTTYEGNNNENG